jgi:hypothetical protein
MQPISRQYMTQRVEGQQQAWQQRKKRLQEEEARYTLVLHSARKELDLTINEYCLADSVHKLSGTRSPIAPSRPRQCGRASIRERRAAQRLWP